MIIKNCEQFQIQIKKYDLSNANSIVLRQKNRTRDQVHSKPDEKALETTKFFVKFIKSIESLDCKKRLPSVRLASR